MRARWRSLLVLTVLLLWAGLALWHAHKPLPEGTHLAGAPCAAPPESMSFLADVTAADAWGRPAVSQGIFDEILHVVRNARRFIVLDYALMGPGAPSAQRRLSAELTDALLEQRRAQPELAVLFLTDPVNEGYGRAESAQLQLLRAAGITVLRSDLDALRDGNFLYSPLWRVGLRWWEGRAFGPVARRFNLKSDHRKVVLADDGRDALIGVVGSANPADAESGWSNVAARVRGASLQPLLASELALARQAGWRGSREPFELSAGAAQACAGPPPARAGESLLTLQVLTEGAIGTVLLRELEASGRGDEIDIATFALADRAVIEALLGAARRGARVRLILDPQEDAHSLAPSGLPNQPVASALVARAGGAIQVRWYRTHGEHFHGSLALVYGPGRLWLTLGSANLTRRSLSDYDLEADVAALMPRDATLAQQMLGYFDTLWSNRAALGIEYTADFAAFADASQADYWLGRLLEGAGLSSF